MPAILSTFLTFRPPSTSAHCSLKAEAGLAKGFDIQTIIEITRLTDEMILQ
jgi:hypothetical protein